MSIKSKLIHLRLIITILLFILWTLWLYLLVRFAPKLSSDNESASESLQFPSNLNQLQQLSEVLQRYSQTNSYYVVILFCSAYLYKQTFAIPGSVFMNILAGALYNVWLGFPLCCLLTAIGATLCYSLSSFSGKVYIVKYFPQRIEFLRRKVDQNRSNLIYVLLFLRLFPMSPNWFLNLASPIIDIPIHLFFLSVFIGLMPYNFICVQTGCLLSQLKSLDDIFNTSTIIKLVLIAIVALLPGILFRKRNKTEKTA